MKTRTETVVKTYYVAEAWPGIETETESYAPVIAGAYQNPYAWVIVADGRSIAWGMGANAYLGTCRDSSQPWAILMRLELFARWCREPGFKERGPNGVGGSIQAENARFALANYGCKNYGGGLFKQHDGQYDRACLYLDYTPETLETWIDRFVEWAEHGPVKHVTDSVFLNGQVVREGCRHTYKTSAGGKITCDECGKVLQKLW